VLHVLLVLSPTLHVRQHVHLVQLVKLNLNLENHHVLHVHLVNIKINLVHHHVVIVMLVVLHLIMVL
jgi:hypothetical protein